MSNDKVASSDVSEAIREYGTDASLSESTRQVGEALENGLHEVAIGLHATSDAQEKISDEIASMGAGVSNGLDAQAEATNRLAAALERIASALEKK